MSFSYKAKTSVSICAAYMLHPQVPDTAVAGKRGINTTPLPKNRLYGLQQCQDPCEGPTE